MKSNPLLPSLKRYLSPTVECILFPLESALLAGSQVGGGQLDPLTEHDPYSDSTYDPFNF